MLTYDDKSLSNMFMKPKEMNSNVSLYIPPVEEFMLARVQLSKNETTEIEFKSACIFIVIKGNGKVDSSFQNEIFKTSDVEVGNIFFNRSDSKLTFTNSEVEELLIFCASFNNSIKF
jgi:mannose-6-phosphate isomerase class I